MATLTRILRLLYFSCLSTAFVFYLLTTRYRVTPAERCMLCKLWCIILTVLWCEGLEELMSVNVSNIVATKVRSA